MNVLIREKKCHESFPAECGLNDALRAAAISSREEGTLYSDDIESLTGWKLRAHYEEESAFTKETRDFDYRVIFGRDKEGKLIKLLGLFLSTPKRKLKILYAREIIETLINHATDYMYGEIEQDVEKKLEEMEIEGFRFKPTGNQLMNYEMDRDAARCYGL